MMWRLEALVVGFLLPPYHAALVLRGSQHVMGGHQLVVGVISTEECWAWGRCGDGSILTDPRPCDVPHVRLGLPWPV